jgi:hypothetical protein
MSYAWLDPKQDSSMPFFAAPSVRCAIAPTLLRVGRHVENSQLKNQMALIFSNGLQAKEFLNFNQCVGRPAGSSFHPDLHRLEPFEKSQHLAAL